MNDSVVANGATWTTDLTGNTYTIEFTAGTELEREAVLDGFTITPAPHSSLDEDIVVTVTTQDSNTINGNGVDSPEVDTPFSISVEVTAVAEELGGRSDVDLVDDLTMNESHDYATLGLEDTWFDLSADNLDEPLDGWTNQDADGSEQTFAVFTPTLSNDGGPQNANGSQFRYSTDGGTTWVTQTFTGTAIEVPMAYIETLQFKAAPDFSGDFSIAVQAHTIDTDPDSGVKSEWMDGSATLTGTINPVADAVTLAVSGRASGLEDTHIALKIRPSSTDVDSSETFNINLSGIPADAILTYDGNILAHVAGSVTIESFDKLKTFTIKPPLNSNEDFSLNVSAVSVDELGAVIAQSAAENQQIDVVVRGDADPANITVTDPEFDEAAVDAALIGKTSGSVALNDVITTASLQDTDGSEVLTIKISGLDEDFYLLGGTFIGGTGETRTWLLTPDDLLTAKVLLPLNFSGTVTADVVAITTENDGDTESSVSVPLSFTVIPTPEATINTTTENLLEDQIKKVDFSLIQQNKDSDEYISSIWIKASDVDSGDVTLYLGDGGPSLSTSGVTLDDGWYKLTDESDWTNIYAQSGPNVSGNLTFDVRYGITDPTSDSTLVDAGLGPVDRIEVQSDATHTLEITAVTDQATLVITSITAADYSPNGTPATTVDANSDTVDASGNTKVTVNLTLTKDEDVNADDERDYDGSEKITEIYIDGVPAGVTVENAVYIGNFPDANGGDNTGRWLLDENIAPVGTNITAATDFTLVFDLSGTASKLSDLNQTLIVNVITEDGNNDSEHTASADWMLTTPSNFNDTNAEMDLAATIDSWDDVPMSVNEDTLFTLDQTVSGHITGDSDFSITITGIPEGSTVQNMEYTVVGGIPTWTASGSGGDVELQALLTSIQVRLPDNYNDNQNPGAGDLDFQSTLTTYTESGDRNSQTETLTQTITPVTDKASVTIDNDGHVITDSNEPNYVYEDDSVTFNIAITNANDGEHDLYSQVVDGNLYVQLTETDMTGGTLSVGGNALVLQAVSGVTGVPDGDYYVVGSTEVGDAVSLVYQPPVNGSGTVKINTLLQTQEVDAVNSEASIIKLEEINSDTVEVRPENDGFNISAENVTGDEDTLIKLNFSSTGLIDTDGSEEVVAVLLQNLPADFLVYTSSDVNGVGAVLANNAGNNEWSIPTNAGQLPVYIAVLPPINWSGSVNGVTLTALTGEKELFYVDTTQDSFDLTVDPIADGLTINPTDSFGTEGQIIDINLNVNKEDDDGSETVTLTLEGLGEYASFYDDGSLITTGVSYDEINDVYTFTGLTEAKLETFGFVQSKGVRTVQVTALTVDGVDVSAVVGGSFTSTINSVQATSGDNEFLYDGTALDGLAGEDTVKLRLGEDIDFAAAGDSKLSNIEIIDLGGNDAAADYDHTLSNLSLEDVKAMAGDGNVLTIDGDAGDEVTLLYANDLLIPGWTFDGSGPDYDVYTNGVTALRIDKDISTTKLVNTPTSGDDVLIYEGNSINGGDGADTIVLRNGVNLDFDTGSVDENKLTNIETIDLGTTDFDHSIANLSLAAIQNMTDSNNALTIDGSTGDSVELLKDNDPLTTGWVLDDSGPDYDVYTLTDENNVVTTVNVSKDITTTVAEYVPTTGDDTFVYDGSMINGLAGEDTIQLRFDEDVSGSDLAANLDNIEILDLNVTGDNEITGLSLQDVLDMTDNNNVLTIDGDGDDVVELFGTGDWSTTGVADINGYVSYTGSIAAETVTLKIEENITSITIVD